MRPKEIKKLIELVESSTINELEVSRFGKKVRIIKSAKNSTAAAPKVVAMPPPVVNEVAVIETPSKAATAEKAKPSSSVNIIEVKSPMVGTFYRAPAPDDGPYIQEGDIVTQNQVLCIIEAMKLMNEIESEFRGRVIEILGENGKPVEYDQPLFKIEKL